MLTPQVNRIPITAANVKSWPSKSPFLQSLGLEIDPTLPGGAQEGDVILLAQRKKVAEVSLSDVRPLDSGETANMDRADGLSWAGSGL